MRKKLTTSRIQRGQKNTEAGAQRQQKKGPVGGRRKRERESGQSKYLAHLRRSPDSGRAFRAGISSSGTALVTSTPACEWHDRSSGAYNILGNITGCGTGAGLFECLQNILLMQAEQQLYIGMTFLPLGLSTYQVPGGGLPPWVVFKGPQGSLIDEYPPPLGPSLTRNRSFMGRCAKHLVVANHPFANQGSVHKCSATPQFPVELGKGREVSEVALEVLEVVSFLKLFSFF
ncbi:hypothetical protein FB451DRAFT_1362857 [Mycena latifolia]|nr:hypothetical protein FB451DRAFT_1362857 [Mycena latifolia]